MHNVIIIFRYLYPQHMITIRICLFIDVIKCGYNLLFTYEAMNILDYYLNLYANLNKLRFQLLHKSQLSTIDGHCLIE
jgi:hypothetical protein